MSVSEWVVPIVASVASVGTTGGAFVAWLNRKTKKDRDLEQQHHGAEIDQLKIDVTKDVVLLLREELKRKTDESIRDNATIEQQEQALSWLRRRVVRLENWAENAINRYPDLPALPKAERENPNE